jgi:hypothetical protein
VSDPTDLPAPESLAVLAVAIEELRQAASRVHTQAHRLSPCPAGVVCDLEVALRWTLGAGESLRLYLEELRLLNL